MKKNRTGRRYRGNSPRCGVIHASQTMAHVLVAFFHALKKADAKLAEEFAADPFGLHGKGAA